MKTLNLFYVLILIVLTNSCAEMNAAMSNATLNDCSQTACVVSTYDNSSGKYLEDTVMSKDRDGNDISYSENI
jgi:hypothetical protein